MQPTKQDKIVGGQRKNRAIRKLLRLDGMNNNVKLTALTIIDFLNNQSGYEVAWPSARTDSQEARRFRAIGNTLPQTRQELSHL